MATNWYIPSTDDVATVMSGVVVGAVQQTGTSDNTSDNQTAKIQTAINMVVARIRVEITNGNRTPLSLTAGSIPPEAQQHCLNLVVELLVNSTPNMGFAVKDGFTEMLKDSKQWLRDTTNGSPSTYPSDPQMTDSQGNVAADGGNGGDIVGEVSLVTDELPVGPYIPPLQVGGTQYTGVVNPNGFQVANVGDQYLLYDTNGELQFVYVKYGTSGNSSGWQQAIV